MTLTWERCQCTLCQHSTEVLIPDPWILEGIFCKVKLADGIMGLCVSRKFNGKLVGHSRLSHVYYGIVILSERLAFKAVPIN